MSRDIHAGSVSEGQDHWELQRDCCRRRRPVEEEAVFE